MSSSSSRPLVIVESPFRGGSDRLTNEIYGSRCLRDSLLRGEAPFASHALYTRLFVLADHVEKERRMGMEAGFAWGEHADLVAVYTDLGISEGMTEGVERAKARGLPVEYRSLGGPDLRAWLWSPE